MSWLTALIEYLTVLLEYIDIFNFVGRAQPTYGWVLPGILLTTPLLLSKFDQVFARSAGPGPIPPALQVQFGHGRCAT